MSKNLCLKEIQTLFKLKTEMNNVKNNFKSSHIENMWCQTCHLFSETQEHIKKTSEYSYNMINGNIEQQEKFVKVYQVILDMRKDIVGEELC